MLLFSRPGADEKAGALAVSERFLRHCGISDDNVDDVLDDGVECQDKVDGAVDVTEKDVELQDEVDDAEVDTVELDEEVED